MVYIDWKPKSIYKDKTIYHQHLFLGIINRCKPLAITGIVSYSVIQLLHEANFKHTVPCYIGTPKKSSFRQKLFDFPKVRFSTVRVKSRCAYCIDHIGREAWIFKFNFLFFAKCFVLDFVGLNFTFYVLVINYWVIFHLKKVLNNIVIFLNNLNQIKCASIVYFIF